MVNLRQFTLGSQFLHIIVVSQTVFIIPAMLPVAGKAEVELFDDIRKGLGPRLKSPPKRFIIHSLYKVNELAEYSVTLQVINLFKQIGVFTHS